MKGPDSSYYRAVFNNENGAFDIYTLLRITVDSEIPSVRYAGKTENALTIVGDRGKEQWIKHVMPYIYKENDSFFFIVRNKRLVAKEVA
jgi:hypothetical protein